MDKKYGCNAVYVHLKRNIRDTAASFVKRYKHGIIKAYRGSGIIMGLPEATDPMSVALDYCDTVMSNIELFLKDKPKKMEFNLEYAKQQFPVFCELIGANVDIDVALSHFDFRYNAS
jgi:hypothetical protein